MKLQFYIQSDKPFAEEDILQMAVISREDEKRKLEFEKTENFSAGKIPIFFEHFDYEEIEGQLSQALLYNIATISEKKSVEAVLMCTYEDFLDILQWSAEKEMKVEAFVTGNRGLILYSAIRKDNCILLVAYGISDG